MKSLINNDKGSFQIVEASFLYPLVIILSMILILYIFIPLLEIKYINEILSLTRELTDEYEFSTSKYINEDSESLNPYRYIFLMDKTSDNEIINGRVKEERTIKENIFFYNKEISISGEKEILDQDEFIRNVDFIYFINERYFSDEIDEIKEKIEKKIEVFND